MKSTPSHDEQNTIALACPRPPFAARPPSPSPQRERRKAKSAVSRAFGGTTTKDWRSCAGAASSSDAAAPPAAAPPAPAPAAGPSAGAPGSKAAGWAASKAGLAERSSVRGSRSAAAAKADSLAGSVAERQSTWSPSPPAEARCALARSAMVASVVCSVPAKPIWSSRSAYGGRIRGAGVRVWRAQPASQPGGAVARLVQDHRAAAGDVEGGGGGEVVVQPAGGADDERGPLAQPRL